MVSFNQKSPINLSREMGPALWSLKNYFMGSLFHWDPTNPINPSNSINPSNPTNPTNQIDETDKANQIGSSKA
jgi:hypothetical protein